MANLPPEPGSSRRSNGLPSAEWGALVDLDPRLSEALLDSLAAVGVPAYVEPAHDVDTVSRATTHPKRPLDRLWVDPDRAGQARDIVSAELADLTTLLAEEEPGATAHGLVRPVPRSGAARVLSPPVLPEPPTGPAAADDDEVFRQIVAGFSLPDSAAVRPWPAVEDLPAGRPEPSPPLRRRRTDRTEPQAGLPGWVEPAALADDGHFEPPSPPPVPRVSLRTGGAVVLLVLGLVMLFGPGLLHLSDTTGVLLLGMVLTGGGAALLVWWMRDAPPTGSGPDDGAVV